MKKTLIGFCLLAGMSAANAGAGDAALAASASRWSSSVMERHAPVDAAKLQKLAQKKKYRYMDMAQEKRSKSIRNAVIVQGGGNGSDTGKVESLQPHTYGDAPQTGRRIVIMRPMT